MQNLLNVLDPSSTRLQITGMKINHPHLEKIENNILACVSLSPVFLLAPSFINGK